MAPRNVLLIIADDLGRQLGCYGNETIDTPNLNQLAAEGVKFTNAFASTASCSGSRSTLYTGQHTHQNGQYGLHNGRNHFLTFDHVETAPSLFNERGYKTGIIGKVHVGPSSAYPWQIREESDTRDVAFIADRCGAFFDKASREKLPFFLTVGFIDPHRDLSRGGFGNDNVFDERVKKQTYDPSKLVVPPFINDTEGTRKELANYYESIARMDLGVGIILDHLERQGFRENTLVLFLSDNGPPFINSKTTLYDAGINLPLIVRCPGIGPPGVSNPNLVSHVDVLPTLLHWSDGSAERRAVSNCESPSSRLGRSFLSILHSPTEQRGWDHVYGSHTFHEVTNYWPTRFIRTTRYKYHRNLAWRLDFPMAADIYGSLSWEDVRNGGTRMVGGRKLRDFFFRPPEELYDLEMDPGEIHNLAQSPEHTKTLESLRERLETWQWRSEDPWLYRDGVSVLFVKHHLAAGLVMPDRVDFEPDQPESAHQFIKTFRGFALCSEADHGA